MLSGPEQEQEKRTSLYCILFLCVFAFAQGLLAQHCNTLFYEKFAPFYDSLSYYNDIIRLHSIYEEKGFLATLHSAITTANGALPSILISFVSFLQPSRAIGVWTQVPWVLSLLITVYYFARLELKASPWLAVALAVPATSVRAIYFFNGGLSDYRMDLHLYLLYGCCLLWFIMAIRQESYKYWLICGIFGSLAALARATAPVYMLATMAPILLIHLALDRKKLLFLIKGMLIWCGCFCVFALWFYIYNYEYLYYYYFVWNTDANMKLPLHESFIHAKYTWSSFGFVMFNTLTLALLAAFPYERLRLDTEGMFEYVGSLRWEVVFLALVPAGFLILRGAGPNPYVSMPSALGIVLVLLCLRGSWDNLSRLQTQLAIVVLAGGCLYNAHRGLRAFYKDNTFTHRIGGYNKLITALEQDHVKGEELRVLSITGGYFTSVVTQNILCMDRGYSSKGLVVQKGDIRYNIDNQSQFVYPTRVEWETIPGTNDQDRIAYLASVANTKFNYAVLPTDATAKMLQADRSSHLANSFCVPLKQEILKTGKWKSLNVIIDISDGESYDVYRNTAWPVPAK